MLGQDGQQPLDHLPGCVLLDGLGDRGERDAVSLQCGPDAQVIARVAREPVELVHDNDIDVALCGDAVEHGAQSGAIRRATRAARLDVLVHERPALVTDVLHHQVALRRDGQTFLAAVALGLLLG
ncbi:MAG TPA: hypothetical protein VFC09_07205 [Candidatus Dormibacteraeota bacterium]|nr:hypothetical protein [Candidatus Dormibacteraeota bacterium]